MLQSLGFQFSGVDHLEFWVGNAMQAASFYCSRFGFKTVAYKGLETGSREVCSYVLQQGRIFLVFSSPLQPSGAVSEEMGNHLKCHGDGVRDVALTVDCARAAYEYAVANGAVGIQEATEFTEDAHGSVVTASVRTFGDTIHTFVERKSYSGTFLPGYGAPLNQKLDPLDKFVGPTGLEVIDHVVGNQNWNELR